MGKLRTYGLIGYPVSHSYSPSMHNAAFRKLKIKAEYKLFGVNPDKFGSFMKRLPEKVSGCNVTIPYKEMAMGYLDKISSNAILIGAVNAIAVRGGRLIGDNTDSRGFVKAFRINTGKSPKAKRVFMFGAGGGAKAVAFGMALGGAGSIVICDVVAKKAKGLASRINRSTKCKAKAIVPGNKKRVADEVKNADVLINATPCGMKKGDPPLLDRKLLHKGLIVCDLIYNPSATPLIRDALKNGLTAMNGSGMLLYQGVLALKFWTGRKPPLNVMKKALEAKMRQVR